MGRSGGTLIDTTGFEGWEDFPALLEEYNFLKKHEGDIYRVALLGDQTWQVVLPAIAKLLIDPIIKRFDPGHGEETEAWLKENIFTKGLDQGSSD